MKLSLCYKEGLHRDALERLLIAEGGFKVVTSAAKVSTVLSATKVHGARVVIVGVHGLDEEDLERLKAASDDDNLAIVAIGETEEEAEKLGIKFDRILTLGASKAKLFRTILELSSREVRRTFTVRERPPIYGMVRVLTPREHEIALKVAEGFSNRDIAYDLKLAEQTVKNLVSVIMRKMECRNRTQVALKLSKQHETQSEA